MPSSPGYKRDYKQEYKKQGASKKAKVQRAENNRARNKAKKAGKVKKGDGKDVAHTKPGAKGSTFIQSASKNRSIPRTATARRKKR
jgi:hypothetical protein